VQLGRGLIGQKMSDLDHGPELGKVYPNCHIKGRLEFSKRLDKQKNHAIIGQMEKTK
jgi:hypothetical protein